MKPFNTTLVLRHLMVFSHVKCPFDLFNYVLVMVPKMLEAPRESQQS